MIKLMKRYAENTENGSKVKVHYYKYDKYVIIYDNESGRDFRKVFGDGVKNDSDVMRDYFEPSYFIVNEGDPLYADALARC